MNQNRMPMTIIAITKTAKVADISASFLRCAFLFIAGFFLLASKVCGEGLGSRPARLTALANFKFFPCLGVERINPPP
jgi:hypothetical protein